MLGAEALKVTIGNELAAAAAAVDRAGNSCISAAGEGRGGPGVTEFRLLSDYHLGGTGKVPGVGGQTRVREGERIADRDLD